MIFTLLSVAGSPAKAQVAPPTQDAAPVAAEAEPLEADGFAYPVTKFEVVYLRGHPDLPPLDQIYDIRVKLGQINGGFVAPRPGVQVVHLSLKELQSEDPRVFYASAVQKALEAVRDHFTARGFMGVFVAPDPFQIDENGRDVRPADEDALRLVVTVGMVSEVRTLGSGQRVDPDSRVNHPMHERVRRQSPIQAAVEGEVRPSLMQRDRLDAHLFWLSRHPGRRADAAISPAPEPGGVTLDYVLTENKPWAVYAQVSNTGTEETSRWRQRFGFFHNQLTGNDDIFSIDYLTANFEDTHAVTLAYEAPVGESRRLRWRVFGGWSEFTASDVGAFDDTFTGESWNVGGELVWNFFQHRDLFLDAAAGVRFENIEVDNTIPGTLPGEEDFLFPYVSLRLDRSAEWFTTRGALTLEFQRGDATGVSSEQLDRLGRPEADENWTALQWDVSHSVFLEPLLDRKAWEDPASTHATLAHEAYAGFRGQHAFGSRLTPQAQQVVGGLYSVRGYPESILAGDTVLIGTAEYRFHLPRSFRVQPEPGELFGRPFRYAPQYPYGNPDWDLIFRTFLDVGRAINVDGDDFFEIDATLVGAGVGVELVVKRNLSLRLDWGFALRGIEERDVDSGSSRVHFVATILY